MTAFQSHDMGLFKLYQTPHRLLVVWQETSTFCKGYACMPDIEQSIRRQKLHFQLHADGVSYSTRDLLRLIAKRKNNLLILFLNNL